MSGSALLCNFFLYLEIKKKNKSQNAAPYALLRRKNETEYIRTVIQLGLVWFIVIHKIALKNYMKCARAHGKSFYNPTKCKRHLNQP